MCDLFVDVLLSHSVAVHRNLLLYAVICHERVSYIFVVAAVAVAVAVGAAFLLVSCFKALAHTLVSAVELKRVLVCVICLVSFYVCLSIFLSLLSLSSRWLSLSVSLVSLSPHT